MKSGGIMSVGLKRFLLALLIIVLIGGAFAGGYFLRDLLNKGLVGTYLYDHAEIVWNGDFTDEEKEAFLEGETEENIIQTYNLMYATTRFVFNKDNTVMVNFGNQEPESYEFVEVEGGSIVRIYAGSNGYYNLVWRNSNLCVDALSTVTTDVTEFNIYMVLIKA